MRNIEILQVWNGASIDDSHLFCMSSIHQICLKDGLPYTLVCKHPELFNGFSDVQFIDFDEYLKGLDASWWEHLLGFHQSQSDLVRLEFAKTNGNILYVDADVELFYLPDFVDNGLPYIGKNGASIDFFLFYVNGNTLFFRELHDAVRFENPSPRSWGVFMEYFANNYRISKANYNKVNIFPIESYKRNWFQRQKS
jgi:hypothetical protein